MHELLPFQIYQDKCHGNQWGDKERGILNPLDQPCKQEAADLGPVQESV